jgi:hypothetical protein
MLTIKHTTPAIHQVPRRMIRSFLFIQITVSRPNATAPLE